MLRFLFIFVFMLASIVPCFALTIDDAVSLALDKSYVMKQQQESVAAGKYGVNGAQLIYFPVIGASYEYGYAWNYGSRVGGQNFHGGSSTASAYLNFNIFNGLNDYSTVGLARLAYDMSKSQLDNSKYDVILNAQNDYINVLKAKSALEVANSNVELLEAQRKDAELSAANGLLSKADVLQVDTYLASAKLQKISAESTLRVSLKTLENVIQTPVSEDEILVQPPFEKVQIPDTKTLRDMMFANRSDLKYLEQSYQSSKKTEMKNLSGIYPKIDMTAGYYRYGDDVNAFNGDFTTKKDEVASVGVTATWNLLGVATSAVSYMSQKHNTQSIAYSIADTKQNMSLDLDTSISNYEDSEAQLSQAQISVRYAQENYRVKKNLFDQKAATQTDLLDAVQILNQAKLDETNAMYSVIASVYKLERIVQEKFPVETADATDYNNSLNKDNATKAPASVTK